MEVLGDIESKIINWSDETKELSNPGTDSKGNSEVPNEEFINGGFGNIPFFPSDLGVRNISYNGSDKSSYKSGGPEKIVVFDDEIGDKTV